MSMLLKYIYRDLSLKSSRKCFALLALFCLILFISIVTHLESSSKFQFFEENSGEKETDEIIPANRMNSRKTNENSNTRLFDDKSPNVNILVKKIDYLEAKIKSVEKKTVKTFPDVKFLTYKDRKRILITGGAGFVGSHLVDHLLMDGHEVIVADNFFTGRKRNVEHWIGHENFELINHDIVNPIYIEVDQIYHLASPASPPHYMFNPVKTIKTNTIGSINILGLAKRVGARVLIASTSEVYGDPEIHPQPESYWGHVNPIGPRACYDEAKRVSETLAYAYKKQEHLEVRVARIFNTYGPRMHMNDGRVVSNFILQALRDKDLTVYGSGNQTRSFQYVSDLVNGLILLMNSNYSLPVNLGNPDEHTIKEFAEIVRTLVGGSSSIIYESAVEDDPQRRKPDITTAKNFISWKPTVSLKDGILATVKYFQGELSRSKHSERNPHHPIMSVT